MKSYFSDKKIQPDTASLKKAIEKTFETWQSVVNFTCQEDPLAIAGWHFAGERYGWSFRVKNPKRILVYMSPGNKHFIISFVFGQRATDAILHSKISEKIKTAIQEAKPYAEGRGIRIEVKTKSVLADLKELIRIKISN